MSNDATGFPFKHEEVDDDSLRLMSISERAALATDRILNWGAISGMSQEEWLLRIHQEFERVAVESIVSCAMMLEQDFPTHLDNRATGELIGGAAGGYLRNNMTNIVAGITIEEDYSVEQGPLIGKEQ